MTLTAGRFAMKLHITRMNCQKCNPISNYVYTITKFSRFKEKYKGSLLHILYEYLEKVQVTLLLNEGIPRALKGKKLRLKNILLLPLIFEEMNSF